VLNILLQMVVVGPVKKLSVLAERVSHGETNVEELKLSGKDEVAVLGESFNRMRISLAKAMNMLEGE
jgi:nitrate/nitrite-specific signal transduction histidine kinase